MSKPWGVHLYQPEGEYPDLHLMRPDNTLATSRRRMSLSACRQAIDHWICENLSGSDLKAAREALAQFVTTTREGTK